MSTLEATIGVVELLSEDNLIKLQNVARQMLLGQESTQASEARVTKQQFMDELEISRRQAELGNVKDARSVTKGLRSKYDI